MLRFESPSQHTARLAPSDRELGGKQIQKRQAVIAVMAAANRDPERFPDPDRFDITRADNRHLAFGYAAHFCFGAPLARAEGQIAFEHMLRRLRNLRLEPQKLVWRNNLGLRGLVSLNVMFGGTAPVSSLATDYTKRGEPTLVAGTSFSAARCPESDERRNNLLKNYLNERASRPQAQTDICRRPEGATTLLSLAQEELWLREKAIDSRPPLYNECVTVCMDGPLDVAVLERSLTEILRRHENWRTRLETRAEQPAQTIHPATAVQLPVVDLRDIPQAKRDAEAVRRVGVEVRRPFEFESSPVIRPVLVRMDDAQYRLYVVAHQMILDGVSVYQIFPSELAALYKAFSSGRPSPLSDLPLQFADFACWHREWVNAESGKQIAYWRKQLSGISAAEWPSRSRQASRTFRGVIQPFALPKELGDKIKKVGRAENSTLFLTLLAAFAALLHGYTKQDDVVVGTLSPSGRKRSEFQGLLGYFLNPVALRFNFADDLTFRDLLAQARKVMSEALRHDDVPIERLARELGAGVGSGHNPFFSSVLSLQPPVPNLDLPWSVTTMDVDSGGSPWDLYLAFIDGPQALTGRAQFNPDLFEPGTVEQILQQFQTLLDALITNPELRLSQVDSPALA